MSQHALRAASKGGALLFAVAMFASSPTRDAATARTPLALRRRHRDHCRFRRGADRQTRRRHRAPRLPDGRIDYTADVDVFSFTVPSGGATFVRVTNLALGARPRLRVLGADGVSMAAQAALAQSAGEYVALALGDVAPGARLYATVSDASPSASGGLYEFSVGRRLASDVAAANGEHLVLPLVVGGP